MPIDKQDVVGWSSFHQAYIEEWTIRRYAPPQAVQKPIVERNCRILRVREIHELEPTILACSQPEKWRDLVAG